MRSTCDIGSPELVLLINEKISEIVIPKLSIHLEDFDYILASFLVKESGENSGTNFHQDPTLVNDSKFISANLWIALQDTNNQNGNLLVVKGSHRVTDCLVVTPNFPTYFKKFEDVLPLFSTSLPVKKGQGIIFNNKLVHAATENHSGKDRIAVVMTIKSKEAEWSHYYLEPGNDFDKIERYEINTNSFAYFTKGKRPSHAIFKEHVFFDFKQLSFFGFKKFMLINYPKTYFKYLYKKTLNFTN
jgi:hypothetical protein